MTALAKIARPARISMRGLISGRPADGRARSRRALAISEVECGDHADLLIDCSFSASGASCAGARLLAEGGAGLLQGAATGRARHTLVIERPPRRTTVRAQHRRPRWRPVSRP